MSRFRANKDNKYYTQLINNSLYFKVIREDKLQINTNKYITSEGAELPHTFTIAAKKASQNQSLPPALCCHAPAR